MSLFDTLFGGTDDSSQQAQIDANKKSRKFIERQSERATRDVKRIFPEARRSRRLGFQGALDVLGQSAPQQIGAFQQGNVGAQQALLAGLPQIQNAILGRPVDLSGLQAQQLQFDPSFLQQKLPTKAQKQRTTPQVTAPQGGNISPQFLADIQRFAEAPRNQFQQFAADSANQAPTDPAVNGDIAAIIARLTGGSRRRFGGLV